MEQWREDVLIHYGVKGMKWGKHRKMSDLERQARLVEGAAKRRDATFENMKRKNKEWDTAHKILGTAWDVRNRFGYKNPLFDKYESEERRLDKEYEKLANKWGKEISLAGHKGVGRVRNAYNKKHGKNAYENAKEFADARDRVEFGLLVSKRDVNKVKQDDKNKAKEAKKRSKKVKRADRINKAVSKINKKFGTKISTYGWF